MTTGFQVKELFVPFSLRKAILIKKAIARDDRGALTLSNLVRHSLVEFYFCVMSSSDCSTVILRSVKDSTREVTEDYPEIMFSG